MNLKAIVRILSYGFYLLMSASLSASPFFKINLAGGIAKSGKAQDITLSPQVTNKYIPDNENSFSGLLSVAGGYQFPHQERGYGNLGLQASFVKYGNFTGKISPLVNVAPDFDQVKYEYTLQTYTLMLMGEWVWLTNTRWQPYVLAAAGIARNEIFGYTESLIECSHSAPSFVDFKPHSEHQFAYNLGVGLTYEMNANTSLELGYLYVNTGEARFNPSVFQSTSESLKTGSMGAHFINVGFIFS